MLIGVAAERAVFLLQNRAFCNRETDNRAQRQGMVSSESFFFSLISSIIIDKLAAIPKCPTCLLDRASERRKHVEKERILPKW